MGFSIKNWYQSWYQAFLQKYQYRYQYRILQLFSISISIGIGLVAKYSISIVSVSKIWTWLVSVSYRYRKKWYRRSLNHSQPTCPQISIEPDMIRSSSQTRELLINKALPYVKAFQLGCQNKFQASQGSYNADLLHHISYEYIAAT